MTQESTFEITCDKCGKKDTVPFKPTVGRPVYCRACFSENRSKQPSETRRNFSFNEKNAWARRGCDFTGKKEAAASSIFQE